MTIWLTSDTHFGHAKVAALRGFDSVAAHDQHLARQWAKVVKPTDTVWHLGDVALGGWTETIKVVATLPGTKHLVLGNHDRAHPLNRNGHKHLAHFGTLFETVQTVAGMRAGGRDWMLSHFPLDGDHTDEPRHDAWRLRDTGTPLFHGHTHTDQPHSLSLNGTPQLHVGVDSWGLAPVALPDLLALL